MTREEMNACLSLTSKSFDYIPYCESEPSCYARLNNIISTNFDVPTSNDMYHLKNSVARSWFFYNKGTKEINEITKKCLAKDASSLPGHVNQSRFYISEAFNELDKTIIKSFEIISKEYDYLKKEDVELIREEKIYDNYISFKQILSELTTGSKKTKSYVSFYNEKIENFKKRNPNLPSNLIERDSIYLKILRLGNDYILEDLKLEHQQIEFYFLSTPYNQIINHFELLLFKTQSLTSLRQLPASDMMLLYSDILGEKNSSLEMFFDLIKEYNKNLKEVFDKKNFLWTQIENNYNTTKKLKLQSEHNENIEFIYRHLISEKISSKQNNDELFYETELKLIQLRKTKFENKLTIGKELSELKNLNNSFILLKGFYEEKNTKNNQQINEVCNKKAQEVLKLKNDILELNKLFDDLLFFANKTLNETELKTVFCKQTIEKEIEFNLGIQNIELLKAKYIDQTRECFGYLDELLPKTNLNELKTIYFQLKKEPVTNENLFYFNEACEKIKTQVNNELSSNQDIQQLKRNYSKLISLQKELLIVNEYYPKPRKTKIDGVASEIAFYEKYRTNIGFDYVKIINVASQLNQRIEKFNFDLEKYLESEKIEGILKNIKFNNSNNFLINAKEKFSSNLQIEINNPFDKIKQKTTIKIPFSINLNTNPLIENYLKGQEESLLIIKEIPRGKTTFFGEYTNKVEYEINSKIILATNKQSIIQESVIIKNKENFEKVFFEINTPNIKNAELIYDGKNIGFILEQGKINFVLENVSQKSKIDIYYYVNDLITIEQKLLKINNLELEKQIVEYKLNIRNTTNQKLTANLLIDFKKNYLVEKVNIYDPGFVDKRLTFINDQILLRNIDFFEFEEKEFLLIATINNSEQYYTSRLINLKEKLEFTNPLLSNKINDHLKYDFSEDWLRKTIELIDETNKFLFELEEEQQKIIQKELIKNELLEKTIEYEKIVQELKELGLINEKEKITKILNEIELLLNEGDEKNLLTALNKINNIDFEIDNAIINELELIKKEIEKNYMNDELKQHSNEIISKINFLLINGSNLDNLKDVYFEIQNSYYELQKRQKEIKQTEIKYSDYLKEKIIASKELIEILKKELNEDNQKMIEIRFIPPITINRLESLELELYSFKEEEILKHEFEIKNIYNELLMSYEDIKRQAIKRFNEGIDKGYSKNVLSKAKEHIDNNNYLLSMFSLIERENTEIQIVGLVPIIFILIIIVFVAIYSKKNNKKNKEDKNKIIESWEN